VIPARLPPLEVSRPPAGEPSDRSLLGRSRKGDEDAATQLYFRSAQRLNGLKAEVNEVPYAHLKLVLVEILQQLPPHSQVMVKLRTEGWDITEVARKTGRSRRTVERILQETRLDLVRILGQED
jgi:DNA-directed RNA polymerase specialized sigma24 family protein